MTVDKALIFNKEYSSYVIHHKLIINYIIHTSHLTKGLEGHDTIKKIKCTVNSLK